MKMFQGGNVLQDGKIGHEFINLIKSDDDNFYIWLNSMGTFEKDEEEFYKEYKAKKIAWFSKLEYNIVCPLRL